MAAFNIATQNLLSYLRAGLPDFIKSLNRELFLSYEKVKLNQEYTTVTM
jgi:hypothetical protein